MDPNCAGRYGSRSLDTPSKAVLRGAIAKARGIARLKKTQRVKEVIGLSPKQGFLEKHVYKARE